MHFGNHPEGNLGMDLCKYNHNILCFGGKFPEIGEIETGKNANKPHKQAIS